MSIVTSPRPRNGQALVEFSLVLPLFLVVFLAVVDFGRAFHSWSTVNHMCVAAARVACKRLNLNVATTMYSATTHASVDAVTAEFWNYLSPLTPRDKISLTMTGVGATNDAVTIAATIQFEPWVPGAGMLLGNASSGAILLSAASHQKKE